MKNELVKTHNTIMIIIFGGKRPHKLEVVSWKRSSKKLNSNLRICISYWFTNILLRTHLVCQIMLESRQTNWSSPEPLLWLQDGFISIARPSRALRPDTTSASKAWLQVTTAICHWWTDKIRDGAFYLEVTVRSSLSLTQSWSYSLQRWWEMSGCGSAHLFLHESCLR